jgi:hypothetical protein
MPAVSNTHEGGGSKLSNSMNSTGKLDIIHRYLVLQIYVGSGDPFMCELHIKDKNNV